MKRLKIRFLNFSKQRPPEFWPYYNLIAKHYEIDQTGRPDYIIDRGLPILHYQYGDCVKILFVNENEVPDFNQFDYAVGFDYLSFGDRYIRHPLFARYPTFALLNERRSVTKDDLAKRKFCSFVVSNSDMCDPIRRKFFERLSEYKRVDSGGKYLNNVGGPVSDKIEFCRNYKFNIAFENSSSLGYTTEKIMEAYAARSVPIYFGNPRVDMDFSLDSMVRVRDVADIDRAVDEVIRLDRDDAAYLEKVNAPCLVGKSPDDYDRELERFLCSIFDRSPEEARRRNRYGYQMMMQNHMQKIMNVDRILRDVWSGIRGAWRIGNK